MRYGGKAKGTITFAAGAVAATIAVPIWSGPSSGNDKAFTIKLSNVTGAGVTVLRPSGTGTILAS